MPPSWKSGQERPIGGEQPPRLQEVLMTDLLPTQTYNYIQGLVSSN